jgi:hypothetical protein
MSPALEQYTHRDHNAKSMPPDSLLCESITLPALARANQIAGLQKFRHLLLSGLSREAVDCRCSRREQDGISEDEFFHRIELG